jgi:hypothetical protein
MRGRWLAGEPEDLPGRRLRLPIKSVMWYPGSTVGGGILRSLAVSVSLPHHAVTGVGFQAGKKNARHQL